MNEYHKIQTIFKREQQKPCRIIEGQFSRPEFEYLYNSPWEFTEKVDGTNIRVIWDGEKVRFGGKTDNAQIPAPLFARLTDLFPSDKFAIFDGPACLYGEGYGGSIQKAGKTFGPNQDFVLFDVLVGRWWLERQNIEDVASKMGIKVVPVVGIGTLGQAVELVRVGMKSQWGDFTAEGIVARPMTTLFNRFGERVITKIKHCDFFEARHDQ